MSQVTIDLEELETEHTDVEVKTTDEEEGGENPYLISEDLKSPFRVRKR